MLGLLLLACAPDFDETRKDLDGFRLVALAADGGALRTLVWSGEGAWHATAPTVTWSIDGVEVSEAPPPPFSASVSVESADGAVEAGLLVVAADAVVPDVTGFTRTVDGSEASLALDVAGDVSTRWMGTSGTFTETGPDATDWVADADGTATIIGLTLDGRGGNTWNWIDVATGPATPTLAVDGRLLPMDGVTAATGWFLATLTAADTLAGYTLTDVVESVDGTGGEIVCGLDPFDISALADGRCGRDEAAGARVALFGEAIP